MPKLKVAITVDSNLLQRVDRLVRAARYPNRSRAIEAAIAHQLDRLDHRRLAEECAKLDPMVEQALANEGMRTDLRTWPEY